MVDPTCPIIKATGYSPFKVSDSLLRITTESRPASLNSILPVNVDTGKRYAWVSGCLTTRHYFYFKPPVLIEARIKFARGKSLWGAFWTNSQEVNGRIYFESKLADKIPWGKDRANFEVDIAEYIPEQGVDRMNHAMHWTNKYDANDLAFHAINSMPPTGVDFAADFHVYGLHWTQGHLDWLIDGAVVYRADVPPTADPGFQYLIFGGMTVGGHHTWATPPDHATPDQSYTLYDWIKVSGRAETAYRLRPTGREPF